MTYAEPEGLRFTKDWCKDQEKDALNYALDQVQNDSGGYIEIGSFEGRSTVFIANKIYPKQIHAVDTWQGGGMSLPEMEAYMSDPIEDNFRHNIQVGTQGNVCPHRLDWEVFLNETWGNPISFIYIDGPHDYQSVYKTLERVTLLMLKGGVILGDDFLDPSVRSAAVEFFGRKEIICPVSDNAFYWRK